MQRLVYTALACLMSVSVVGQSELTENLKFGVVAGANISSKIVKGEISPSKVNGDYNLGFHAGGFIKNQFENRISFTSEFLYIQKGFKSNEELSNYIFQDQYSNYYRWEFGYISSSNSLNYSIIGVMDLFAGFEVSYLLYDKIITENGDIFNPSQWLDSRKYDISAIGGISIKPNNTFAFSIRYIHGFISIYDPVFTLTDQVGSTIRDARIRHLNRTWSLSVIYYL